ncbi:hypothetical protein BYT27DRAFT_7181723 [Phlegmacium glaucopus]|nr:hypothetical protein BYT27DRAFT_7181723 [Phlegmacium glaucopus]
MLSNIADANGTVPIPSDPLRVRTLCFLPRHEMVFQVLVAKYVTVALMAVFPWENLNHIFSDYELLSEHRISFPVVIYFISRLSYLGFIITNVVVQSEA